MKTRYCENINRTTCREGENLLHDNILFEVDSLFNIKLNFNVIYAYEKN